jgi:hypothetical protein
MNFEQWMMHRGLSNSSTNKYLGAIDPICSDPAQMTTPLLNTIKHTSLAEVDQSLGFARLKN